MEWINKLQFNVEKFNLHSWKSQQSFLSPKQSKIIRLLWAGYFSNMCKKRVVNITMNRSHFFLSVLQLRIARGGARNNASPLRERRNGVKREREKKTILRGKVFLFFFYLTDLCFQYFMPAPNGLIDFRSLGLFYNLFLQALQEGYFKFVRERNSSSLSEAREPLVHYSQQTACLPRNFVNIFLKADGIAARLDRIRKYLPRRKTPKKRIH